MRETIKVILTYWVRRLAEEPSQTTLRITDAGERFYCLDKCQAWFLQDVASAAGDAELLRLAGTIERLLRERELAHEVDGERAIANEEQRLAYYEEVRKRCIRCFYLEPRFNVDLSRYRAKIQSRHPKVIDARVIERLASYLDEKQWLNQLYMDVRHSLQAKWFDDAAKARPPEPGDIETEFRRALRDAYRRADASVAKLLREASGQSPPGRGDD